jgi:pre-mRNA-processing factor SLU7
VVVQRTKYEEGVTINNHTSVWGSYFNRAGATWAYKCCHSCLKNSYCTGLKGQVANDSVNKEAMGVFTARKMLDAAQTEVAAAEKGTKNPLTSRSELFGSDPSTRILDPKKLEAARLKAVENESTVGKGDDRKRGYNSMQSVEVTVEDMEVYRMKKAKGEDPMEALMESGELLEYEKK